MENWETSNVTANKILALFAILTATDNPATQEFEILLQGKMMIYMGMASLLGALSAVASLLGSDRPLTARIFSAYLISGGLVSLGVVLLAGDLYGYSPFLVGVAIFAGYKSFDSLTALASAATALLRKVFNLPTK